MGHLLQTVNPAAAAAIRPDDIHPPSPLVGQWVLYRCRPGEARQGRMSVPALVLWVDANGLAELLVKYGSDDEVTKVSIPPYGPLSDYHCWMPVDAAQSSASPNTIWEAIDAVNKKLDELEEQVRILTSLNTPPRPPARK